MGAAPKSLRPTSTDGNPFQDSPPVGDFFAPFFTVEFTNYEKDKAKTADGKDGAATARLTTSGKESSYKFTNVPKLRSFATSLEIVHKGGAASFATLRLEPPYEDAIEICESRAVQKDAIMSCYWGYLPSHSGMKAVVSRMHHFIVDQPSIEASGADVSITIRSVDTYSSSATRREDRTIYPRNLAAKPKGKGGTKFAGGTRKGVDDSSQRTAFPTDLDVIRHLAKKNDLKVNADWAKYSTLTKKRPLNKDEPDVLEQNTQDWVFFKEVCKNNRCDFLLLGTTLYIVDTNYIKVQKAVYRLVMMQQPQDGLDIPLLSFSANSMKNMFTPAAATEVQRLSGDPDSGDVFALAYDPTVADDHEFLGERTEAGRALAQGRTVQFGDRTRLIPDPRFTPTETGRHVSVPHGKADKDESVKWISRSAVLIANTEARATVPGVPTIVPWTIVQVLAGFPTTFDGPYMIKQVTHRLDSSGYEVELELIRDMSSKYGLRPKTGGNDPPVRKGGGREAAPRDQDGKPK
jgi:hypothetical protein